MNKNRLMQVLITPQISEKALRLADTNRQFVFKVLPDATKPEVKEAVEFLFKVKVKNVQMLRVKGKQKTFGKLQGRRKDWKKAYVGLKEGYDINYRVGE